MCKLDCHDCHLSLDALICLVKMLRVMLNPKNYAVLDEPWLGLNKESQSGLLSENCLCPSTINIQYVVL